MREMTRGHMRAALPAGSGVSQCGGCGLVFKSVTGFDRHRIGPGEARRCLPVPAMLALGMSGDEREQWIASAYDRGAA